jgi:hypothetical protein
MTHFDAEGSMDPAKKQERQRLAMMMNRPPSETELPKGIIDINTRLSEKQYDHQFRWCPTEQESVEYHRRIENLLGIYQ